MIRDSRPLARRIVSASSSACVGCSCWPSPALTTEQETFWARSAAAPALEWRMIRTSGPHRVQRHRRVDQRLALLHRGIADRHVHHVGAEALACEFEGGLRSCRCLEEEVDLRQSPKGRRLFFSLSADLDGFVSLVEKIGNILLGEALDANEVAVGEKDHDPASSCLRGVYKECGGKGQARAVRKSHVPHAFSVESRYCMIP